MLKKNNGECDKSIFKRKLILSLLIIFLVLFVIGLIVFMNIKDTYSIDANTDYTITYHQAWGADGESRWHSDNLPKRCTTRYGKVIFDSCTDDIGICYYWAKRKNGDTNHSPIKEYEKIDAVDIKYEYVNKNFASDIDLYCAAGGSKGNSGSPQELTSVKVTKKWIDNNNSDGLRPKSVFVELYINSVNGKDLGINGPISVIELSNSNNWEYTFTDLPVYVNHNNVKYYIKEKPINDYTTKIDGFNITNTHIPRKININGKKTWDDNNNSDNIRPETVMIELYNGIDEKPIKSVTISESDNWEYSFKDLPEFKDGKKINYIIKEKPIDGYTSKIDGFNITNTHISYININGKKTWDDNNNSDNIRPETVTIELYNGIDEKPIKSVTISESDNWEYSFKDLPEFKDGKKINYIIKEKAIDGYTSKQDGFNITNVHIPETIEIKGKKIWNDNNNEHKFRPKKITVSLFNNIEKEALMKTEISEKDNWEYRFNNLPKYKDGLEIIYRIEETPIEHYETTIDGYNIINDVIVPNPPTGNSKYIIIGTVLLISSTILTIFIIKNKRI